MFELEETRLPGIGIRYTFDTKHGERIGVLAHRDGRREIVIYDADDPDASREVISLDQEESAVMTELLGGSRITRQLADLKQEIEGLALDWLPLSVNSPYAGRKLGDARIRTRTGVSVVAVVRDENAFAAPGPSFVVEGGDTIVVVGTSEGIEATIELLKNG